MKHGRKVRRGGNSWPEIQREPLTCSQHGLWCTAMLSATQTSTQAGGQSVKHHTTELGLDSHNCHNDTKDKHPEIIHKTLKNDSRIKSNDIMYAVRKAISNTQVILWQHWLWSLYIYLKSLLRFGGWPFSQCTIYHAWNVYKADKKILVMAIAYKPLHIPLIPPSSQW